MGNQDKWKQHLSPAPWVAWVSWGTAGTVSTLQFLPAAVNSPLSREANVHSEQGQAVQDCTSSCSHHTAQGKCQWEKCIPITCRKCTFLRTHIASISTKILMSHLQYKNERSSSLYHAKNKSLQVQYLLVLKHNLVIDFVLFVKCPKTEDLFLSKQAKSLIYISVTPSEEGFSPWF